VPNNAIHQKMKESIENKGWICHRAACLRTSNLRQKRHNGADGVPFGTVEFVLNNKETKEQSPKIRSSLLCNFVVQIICCPA
jgi:hypothetical protein